MVLHGIQLSDCPFVRNSQRKGCAPLGDDEASSTIKIGDTNAACNCRNAGALRYESPEGVMELCNGHEGGTDK